MSKKVLFIAFHFPPESDAGVYRSINFVRHLRSFGYEPVVLTVTEEDIQERGARLDHDLLQKLPEGIEIIRTSSGFPYAKRDALMQKRLFRFAWLLNYSKWREHAVRWVDVALEQAKALVKKHNIELVYTSSAPYTAMELGLRLKQEMGIKWVADLRDPFTDAYANTFPSKFHFNAMRKWEKRVFSQADRLIVNTPEVKRLYLERGLTTPDKISHLTNGFLK